MTRIRSFRPVRWSIALGLDWLGRFASVQGFDRAMAIGASAYTALIPLLIVYASLLPRSSNRSFADTLIERMDLTGSTAAAVRAAFAPPGTVQSSVTIVGVLLLIVSALSFARALQRLYEGAFGLEKRGIRDTKYDLAWLVVVCVIAVVRPSVTGGLSGHAEVIASLVLSTALWLVTPYLLLGRRLHWLRLVPAALMGAIGMAGVGIWTVIWMPHTIASSAARFGVIGVGFALLTWLVATACVIVVATTGGAMVAQRLGIRVR